MAAEPSSKKPLDSTIYFRWLRIVIPVFLFVVAVALILPAIQQAREAARRSQSKNNLKQIGLALHNYLDSHRVFPPGGTFNAEGQAHHGWGIQLMPYYDASPLYNWTNFQVPWNNPENAGVFRTRIEVFLNPSLPRPAVGRDFARVDYSANSHLLAPNSSVGLSHIRSQSATMIMGELGGDFVPWGCPFNWRPLKTLTDEPRTYGRPEGFGGHLLMVDGSVTWMSPEVDPDVLEALRGPDLAGNAFDGAPIVRPPSFPYPADALDRSFMAMPGSGRCSAILMKNARGDVIEVSLQWGKGDTRAATDSDLAALSEFRELRELRADGDFTDAGMMVLSGFRHLEILRLSSHDVTDTGLEFLQQLPSLRHLSLEREEVTTACATIISAMPRLEELTLKVARRSEGLLELESKLPPAVQFKLIVAGRVSKQE